jgi:hypothetical protein
MKVVSKQIHVLTQAVDLLGKILLERIQAQVEGSPFNIEKYKSEIFKNALDQLLHLEETFSFEEKLVLILGLTPYVRPGYFEDIIAQALPSGGEFIPFGGVKGQQYRGVLPTGETALFLLAGMDIAKRLEYQKLFSNDGLFATYGLLQVESVPGGEPTMSGKLVLDPDWLEKILLGKEASPAFSMEFPARKITTQMLWEDLVLHPQTFEQVNDIQTWLSYYKEVLQDATLGRKIKPGYRVLFYGNAGTGKTLTATLLGKKFNTPIYRIDLSQVVSKYIGETEKHIEWVFTRAERKNWILFFDEADALFGKRINVQSSNDKFANQEVSYLLQRIEEYNGLLILASNFKNNIDDAFLRRFHNIIHFPMPGANERFKLWNQNTPCSLSQEKNIDWKYLSNQFEISGAEIVNVMYYASLKTFARNSRTLLQSDILDGIRKEFKKQEKAFHQ